MYYNIKPISIIKKTELKIITTYYKETRKYKYTKKVDIEVDFNERINIYNKLELTKKPRARPVSSYKQLIDILEVYEMSEQYQNKFFTLRILYRPLSSNIKDDDQLRRWSKNPEEIINNKTISDLIDILKKDISELEDKYSVNLKDEDEDNFVDNLYAFTLQETLPFFGASGRERIMTVINNNELYTIYFPRSINRCVLISVYNSLNLNLKSKEFKNLNISNMTHLEQIKYLEENKNIKITIIQNKIEKQIILFI